MKSQAARKPVALEPSRRQIIQGGMAVAGIAAASPLLSACKKRGGPAAGKEVDLINMNASDEKLLE
jgi:hypothetical protein